MIEPIPKLKLKNACPIALKKVAGVTSEKFGANKKLKPLAKSPFIIEFTTITIIRTNNIGINNLTILSIPETTPAPIIIMFISMNAVCQNNNFETDAVWLANFSVVDIPPESVPDINI